MTLYDIWDLDNCLADDAWRQDRIEWDKTGDDRYRKYNEGLGSDELCHRAEFALFRRMGSTPVFFTGRSEYLRAPTNHWINRNLASTGMTSYPLMYMRPDNAKDTPRALKDKMLQCLFAEHLGFGSRIVAAFDDLPIVVQMYRDNNIPAVQLAIHADYSKAYKAEDLV